jgi:hypothetical protein
LISLRDWNWLFGKGSNISTIIYFAGIFLTPFFGCCSVIGSALLGEIGLWMNGNCFYTKKISHLQDVLNKLGDRGNMVLVIEHQMDMIKVADHIIDLGPEGGDGGGRILFEGTPEELVKNKESYTAEFLKLELILS